MLYLADEITTVWDAWLWPWLSSWQKS